jgi:hypothetical protein
MNYCYYYYYYYYKRVKLCLGLINSGQRHEDVQLHHS